MIDYKEVLKWYMKHIGDVEGTDFTGKSLNESSMPDWAKEIIREVSNEIDRTMF